MAKRGEGDPRWIVEERPDATNINNWHWAEKNASQWSKTKFKELIEGKIIREGEAYAQLTEITKCDGDAGVYNRKGRLIFFYEWSLDVKWKGGLLSGNSTSGMVKISNLSEENDVKEVDISIEIDSPSTGSEVVEEMMMKAGKETIRDFISSYLRDLKEEFPKGLILPTKASLNQNESTTNKAINKTQVIENVDTTNQKNSSLNFETAEMNSTESFKCTAEEFYRAFTMKELVEAFTQGPCVIDPVEGGEFELFNGNVKGKFIKLDPEKLIKLKWRFQTWPQGYFSDVTIEIVQKDDCTDVVFFQKGIPKTELENTSEGWKRYYWDSMKRTFGFGSSLF